MYICVYVYIYIYMCIYVCMHTHVYIHIYIYIYILHHAGVPHHLGEGLREVASVCIWEDRFYTPPPPEREF